MPEYKLLNEVRRMAGGGTSSKIAAAAFPSGDLSLRRDVGHQEVVGPGEGVVAWV